MGMDSYNDHWSQGIISSLSALGAWWESSTQTVVQDFPSLLSMIRRTEEIWAGDWKLFQLGVGSELYGNNPSHGSTISKIIVARLGLLIVM